MRGMRALAAALVVLCGCGPSSPLDRVSVRPRDAAPARSPDAGSAAGGGPSEGPTGGPGGADGGAAGVADVSPMPSAADGAPAQGPSAPPDGAPAPVPTLPAPDAAPDAVPEPAPPDAAPDLPPDAPVQPDSAPVPPAPRVAQLIVGSPTTPFPGDIALRTLLAVHLPGFEVRLRDDVAPIDLKDVELIVIAGSVSSDTVGSKFRDVPVPVLCLEYTLFDNLGMTAAVDQTDLGGDSGGTQVDILDPTHPLAAGLSGLVTVVSARSNLAWGRPAAAAARVASIPGLPNRSTIFAYTTGAAMTTLAAPARRLGLFALETAAARLSDGGIQLLRAAVDWALLAD